MIRVLHVIGKMDCGGAEAMIMNLYRNINRDLVQFDFLVNDTNPGFYDNEIKKLGGNIYNIKRFNGANFFSYYSECLHFFSNHPEIKVVHGHIGSSAALYIKAAKKHGCFTIAHSHNVVPINSLHALLFHIYAFPVRFSADSLFSCSTEAGISRYGKKSVKRDNYHNFYNAIDTSLFRFSVSKQLEIRNEFGLKDDAFIIGAIGRITAQKNPSMILEIMQNIINRFDNVYCIWVGTGDLFDFYKKQIFDLKLDSKIIMTGVRKDVPDLLSAFDIFIMPSLYEGLPVVGIEAQAAGLPCYMSKKISKEVAITDLIKFLDVDNSTSNWIDELTNQINSGSNSDDRYKYADIVGDRGYDIKKTSLWLTNYYISHSKEETK